MATFINDLRAGAPEAWFLLFVIYWTLMCGYGLIYCFRINLWASVFGDLEQSEVGLMSPSMELSEQNYAAEMGYSFVVDGKPYKGHRLSPFLMVVSRNLRFLLRLQMKHIEIRKDGKVRIFYNPRRPHKSYLIRPGPIGYSVLIIGMLVPLILFQCY